MYKSLKLWMFNWEKLKNDCCVLETIIGEFSTFEEAYYFTHNSIIVFEANADNSLLIIAQNKEKKVEDKFFHSVNKDSLKLYRIKPKSKNKLLIEMNDFTKVGSHEYEIAELPRNLYQYSSFAYSILDQNGESVEHDRIQYKYLEQDSCEDRFSRFVKNRISIFE